MPTVSHSWKASLPIRCVGTCPVMTTIGIEFAERVGEAGDGVGGAGTRRDQHAADLAGRARIAFGGVHRALLVPHQDVLDHLLLEDRVIDRQHRAARIAEDVLHALIGERLDHHFGAGHFPARRGSAAHVCRHGPLHSLEFRLIRRPFGNQKGAEKPLVRAPPLADGLQPPPAMRLLTSTSALSNNIAHVSRLSAFPCAAYIRTDRP